MNTSEIVKPAQNNNGSGQSLDLPKSVLEDRPHSTDDSHATKAPFDSEIFREQANLLDKYTGQVRAVINGLFDEDNRDGMNNGDITNILWLVDDRLEDIQKASQAIWEAVIRPINGEIVSEDR
jgi:hypothetical protein